MEIPPSLSVYKISTITVKIPMAFAKKMENLKKNLRKFLVTPNTHTIMMMKKKFGGLRHPIFKTYYMDKWNQTKCLKITHTLVFN
jgi:hypothetical protein